MSLQGTILLTNDDGIRAPGLAALAAAFAARFPGRIAVVAPADERSAVGCGVTLGRPVLVKRAELPGLRGIPAYAVSGTPVDCVKLAVHEILPQGVALVCSGVNYGANLGTDVFYSGTVSAAIEAAIIGLPGVAVSVARPGQSGFGVAAEVGADVAAMVMRRGLPERTLLNVNLPHVTQRDQLKPAKITRLGARSWDNRYLLEPAGGGGHGNGGCSGDGNRTDTGRAYTWSGQILPEDDQPVDTDLAAVRLGHVSITPVHLDLTNHAVMATLEEWLR